MTRSISHPGVLCDSAIQNHLRIVPPNAENDLYVLSLTTGATRECSHPRFKRASWNCYHPHVRFIMPGGGISPDGSKWLQVNQDQQFHPLPAMGHYKKLFVEAICKAGLYDQLPPGVLKFDWVVNLKPVGDGRAVLKDMSSLSRCFIRHGSRITACELPCQSEQNPIGFPPDSELLEQRI